MPRLLVIALALIWLMPAEAGLFHRKRPTAAQQMKRDTQRTKPTWGAAAHQNGMKQSRKKKAKVSPLATRPRSKAW